jgi:hypothetical protein
MLDFRETRATVWWETTLAGSPAQQCDLASPERAAPLQTQYLRLDLWPLHVCSLPYIGESGGAVVFSAGG